MILEIAVCDLCRSEERITPAHILYKGDSDLYHACKKHAKEIEKYQLPILETFRHPGNLDDRPSFL